MTLGMKSRERESVFLQVAVNSGSVGSHLCTDVCSFVAGACVEREMIHTFTGGRGIERGRRSFLVSLRPCSSWLQLISALLPLGSVKRPVAS